jgi:hypothetical protein
VLDSAERLLIRRRASAIRRCARIAAGCRGHQRWNYRSSHHRSKGGRESLLRSIVDVLGVNINVPDHTTLSRRGGGLAILPKRLDRGEPLILLVGSTGLKIFGEGEWLDQKYGDPIAPAVAQTAPRD